VDAIGDAIGEAVATFLADPLVGLATRLVASYVILIWLAAALWAFADMRRRSSSLVLAYAAAALVILATPILFPAAILVYTVLRPDEFASDREIDRLRHAAFALETNPRCEGCNRSVDDDWLICPTCRRQLAHRCHECGATVGLDWSVCGWCAAELDGNSRQWPKRAPA
jgi:hypothetical protein